MTKTITLRPTPKTKEEFIASATAESEVKTDIMDKTVSGESEVKPVVKLHKIKNAKIIKSKIDNNVNNNNTNFQIARKAVLLPEDLAQAFLDFEYEQKKAGKKVSFQSFVESLLRVALKKYL